MFYPRDKDLRFDRKGHRDLTRVLCFSRLDSHVGGKIEDFGGERNPRGKLHHRFVFHVQQPDIGGIWKCVCQHVLREVLLDLHDADWWSVNNRRSIIFYIYIYIYIRYSVVRIYRFN